MWSNSKPMHQAIDKEVMLKLRESYGDSYWSSNCVLSPKRERPKAIKYIKQNGEDYNEAIDNTIGK